MLPNKVTNRREGPEKKIQDAIVKKLESLDWLIKVTHGNLYSFGWPDLYAAHKTYRTRWIEVKDPSRTSNIFTQAQLEFFHLLGAKDVGVWVLTNHSDDEIKKLFKPPNWYFYLDCMR